MKLSTIIKHKLQKEINSKRFSFKYSYQEFINDWRAYTESTKGVDLLNKHFQKKMKLERILNL